MHGTKADVSAGETLVAGRESNFEEGRLMNYVYFTSTLDAATWGAELAAGNRRGRIYIVEPTGDFEDDPNVTDKKFPGNPTQSFRSSEPLLVVGELVDGSVIPRRSSKRSRRDTERRVGSDRRLRSTPEVSFGDVP